MSGITTRQLESRYIRADQQSAAAVEPLRLTCASSGADSAAAAVAAAEETSTAATFADSSASFVASTSLSAARAAEYRFFRVDESFRTCRVDESFRAGTRAGLTRARSLNTWFIRNETR
jgi:hypothetical protein